MDTLAFFKRPALPDVMWKIWNILHSENCPGNNDVITMLVPPPSLRSIVWDDQIVEREPDSSELPMAIQPCCRVPPLAPPQV